METDKILLRTGNLPAFLAGKIAEDYQIWEGNEQGAHFKVTKEILPIPNGPTVYMLSVSGPAESKEKVIADFVDSFGEPIMRFEIPKLPGIDYVSWDAKEIDGRRKNK
jgi:hypothetical protein